MLGNALTAAVSLSTTAGDISEDVTLSSDTEPVINIKKREETHENELCYYRTFWLFIILLQSWIVAA